MGAALPGLRDRLTLVVPRARTRTGLRAGPARVDAAGLRRAARDVLADRGVRDAVERMGRVINRSGGAPAAVDVVEGVLGARGA